MGQAPRDFRIRALAWQQAMQAGRYPEAQRIWAELWAGVDTAIKDLAGSASNQRTAETNSAATQQQYIPAQVQALKGLTAQSPIQSPVVSAGIEGTTNGNPDADAGYPLKLGMVVSGEAVQPGSAINVQNGAIRLAKAGTAGYECHGVAVRGGQNAREMYYRCGGHVYALVTGGIVTGSRLFLSTTPGFFTENAAESGKAFHQECGQYHAFITSPQGTSKVVAMSLRLSMSTADTFGLLTVHANDPFRFNVVGAGRELEGINGTWDRQGGVLAFINGTSTFSGITGLTGGFTTAANSSVTGTFDSSGAMSEASKRVVVPDRVTAGAGISIASNNGAGTVVVTNTGVITEADTLDSVCDRGAITDRRITTAGVEIIGDENDPALEIGFGSAAAFGGSHAIVATGQEGGPADGGAGGAGGGYNLECGDGGAGDDSFSGGDGGSFVVTVGTGGTDNGGGAGSDGTITLNGNTAINGQTTLGNSSTAIVQHLSATANLDFPNITGLSQQELTITVTGASSGDTVIVTPNSGIESGLEWCGYVSAADTVTVRLITISSSAVNPASRDWRADVWKH